MRIKFIRDYEVQAEGGEKYRAGQTVDLPRNSAQHFINRGAAEEAQVRGRAEARAVAEAGSGADAGAGAEAVAGGDGGTRRKRSEPDKKSG